MSNHTNPVLSTRNQSEFGAHPKWFRRLGPGLITGAADDDPSGIATYSQAGAAFGYSLLWTLSLCLPLMIAVQEAVARIGAVTGRGLAKVTSEFYSRRVLFAVVSLVFVANVINIGADIAAVTASVQLLAPIHAAPIAILFTLIVVTLEVFIGYHTYAKVLKVFAVSLLAYVATAVVVGPNWGEIAINTFWPKFEWKFDYWFMVVAILGTTISPYMFFWQAAEEVEELEDADVAGRAHRTVKDLRQDTAIGMSVSQVGSWFMMITTAAVLHAHGITNINSAADAASALEPLVHSFPNAGTLAKAIFAIGVIGLGLLGIPVLAGSASYAVAEALNWEEGLARKPSQARAFYAVLVLATAIGLLLTLLNFDPIHLLLYAAVINGVVSLPLLILIAKLAADPWVMGSMTSGRLSRYMLLLTITVVAISVAVLIVSPLVS